MKWWCRFAQTVQKTTKWLLSAVVVVFLVSYLANVAVVSWKELPDTAAAHITAWLFQSELHRIVIFASVGGLLCVIVIVLFVVPIFCPPEASQPLMKQQDVSDLYRNSKTRQKMMAAVRREKNKRKPPLREPILSKLGLQEKPKVFTLPRKVELPDGSIKPMLSGAEILTGFDQYHHNVLILGDRGSGKTILLQELNEELFSRAEHDFNSPVPVIFNLSSWSVKQMPLDSWFKEQLCDRQSYALLPSAASSWVDNGAIMPLLDGLDEVGRDNLAGCIRAINDYTSEYDSRLIICCREAEYKKVQKEKEGVDVSTEVKILPLEDEQVEEYLSRFEGRLAPLRDALLQDDILRRLARTPLILHMLTLTSLETSLKELDQAPPEVKMERKRVLALYAEKMLASKQKEKHIFSLQNTHRWLKWLAQQMKRGQRPFYLERMQAPWHPKDWRYRLYSLIANGLIAFLIVEAFLIADFGLAPLNLLVGAILGVITTYLSRGKPTKPGWSWKFFGQSLLVSLPIAFVYGLIIAWGDKIVSFLLAWLFLGGIFAVSMTLVYALGEKITPVDLVWSPDTMKRNFCKVREISTSIAIVVFIALFTFESISDPGFVFKAFFGASSNQLVVLFILKLIALPFILLLAAGLGAGFMGILIACIAAPVSGFSNRSFTAASKGTSPAPAQDSATPFRSRWLSGLVPFAKISKNGQRTRPKRGIWRSVQSSLQVGFLCLVSVTVGCGVIMAYGNKTPNITNLPGEFVAALPFGIAAGIIVAIFYGGAASIKHGLLRLILWFSQDIPWDYAYFLDFMTDCFILVKDEEGYDFVHPELLDYFADEGFVSEPRSPL